MSGGDVCSVGWQFVCFLLFLSSLSGFFLGFWFCCQSGGSDHRSSGDSQS